MHDCAEKGHVQVGMDRECLVCAHWIIRADRVARYIAPEDLARQRNGELLCPEDVAAEDEWGRCG